MRCFECILPIGALRAEYVYPKPTPLTIFYVNVFLFCWIFQHLTHRLLSDFSPPVSLADHASQISGSFCSG